MDVALLKKHLAREWPLCEVVIATDRSTLGLDRNEVEEMIRRIGEYADLYDDALTKDYGGVRHCDLPSRS